MNPTKNPGPLGEPLLHPRENRFTKFRGCLSCVVSVDSHCLSPGSFLLPVFTSTSASVSVGPFLLTVALEGCAWGTGSPSSANTLVQLQGTSVRVGYPLNFSFIKNHLKYAFEGGVPLQGNAKKSTFQRPPVCREAKRNHEAVSGGRGSHTQGLSGRGSLSVGPALPKPFVASRVVHRNQSAFFPCSSCRHGNEVV